MRFPTRNSPSLRSSVSPQSFATPTAWREKVKPQNKLVEQMGGLPMNELSGSFNQDSMDSDSFGSSQFDLHASIEFETAPSNQDADPSPMQNFSARPKKKNNRVSMMTGAFESAPAPSRGLVAPKTTGWVEKQKVGNNLVKQMGFDTLNLEDDDVDEEKLDSLIGKATAAFGTKGEGTASSGSKDSGPSALPSFGAKPKKKNNRVSMMAGAFESTPASPGRFVSRGLNAPKTTGWVEKKKVGNSLVNQMGLGKLNLDDDDEGDEEKSDSLIGKASNAFGTKGDAVATSVSKVNDDSGPSALPSFGARPKKKINRVSMMAGAFESAPAPSRGLVAPKTTGWVEKQKVGNGLVNQMGLGPLKLDDDDDVDEEKLDSLIGKATAAFGTKGDDVPSSGSKANEDSGPSAMPSFGARPKKKNNRISMMAGVFESTPASPRRFVSRGLNAPKTTGWVEKKKVGNSLVNQMGLGKLNLDDDAKDDEKSNTKSTSQRVGGPKSASLADDSQQAPTTPKSLDVPTAASKSTGWREKLKLRNNLVRNMVAQQRLLPMEDMAGGGYDVSWGKRGSIEFTGDDDIARAAFMSRSSSVFADEDDAPVGDLKRGSISKQSSGCNYRASIADDDGPVRSWFWGKRTSINYVDDDEDDIARAAYHSRSSFVFDDDDDDDPRVSQMRKSLSKRMSGLKRASFSGGGSKQAPAEPKELEVPTASSKSAGWREKLKLKNDMVRNMVTQQRLLPMEDLRNGGYDAAWGQRASIEFTGDDEIARAAFMSRSSFVFDNDNDGPIGDLKRGSISKRSSGYNYCASFAAAPATPSSNAGPQGNASKSTGYVEKLKLRNNLLRQMGQHSLPLGDDDENLSSSFWGKRTSINYIDDDDDDIARSAYHSRSSFVFDDNDDPRVSRMRKSMSQRKSAINHRQSLAGVAEDAPSTPTELEVPTARCKSTGWREKLKLKN